MNIKQIDQFMVGIPAGVIIQRDDRKKTQWTSDIQPFRLCSVPTTQSLYYEVMGEQPSFFPSECCPVECVSWFDAIKFCNRLSELKGLQKAFEIDESAQHVVWLADANGFRLPTDAEWEYSCRAGQKNVQYGEIDDIAWYEGNSNETTHPVGEKAPNTFGLYDMLGNVWEWCWDQYDAEVYGSYRIFRGGGWGDASRGCLATNRRRSHPIYCIEDLGFRIARS